ncbi:MAG: hypothetical protein ACRDOY_12415 [Nocardioidaceae bacterium]
MTFFILILSVVVVALAVWALNRVISGDGLGYRFPPPSHHDDIDSRTPLGR